MDDRPAVIPVLIFCTKSENAFNSEVDNCATDSGTRLRGGKSMTRIFLAPAAMSFFTCQVVMNGIASGNSARRPVGPDGVMVSLFNGANQISFGPPWKRYWVLSAVLPKSNPWTRR